MGTASRKRRSDERFARERARRLRVAAAAPRAADPLKVVVATFPDASPGGVSLAKDVDLVRAALLYADEVELVSTGAAMLGGIASLAAQGEDAIFDLLATQSDETLRLLGAVPRGDFRQVLPLLKVAVKLDPALLRSFSGAMEAAAKLEKAQQDLQTMMDEFRVTSDRMVTDAGGTELSVAIEAGLLTLSPSGLAEDAKTMDAILANYVGLLSRHLQDPRARMLFDGQAAALVRSLVATGAVTPHPLALTGAGQSALASGFVARLPVFAPAPMDEVLDLRRDLSEPLVRYRRAISQMSARLTYQAYESETAVEIDNLWREEVEPALLEIREQMADHSLTREVVRVLRTDLRSFIAGLTSGGSMWVGVETLTSLTGAAAALSGLATGVGVTGVHTMLKSAQQRHDARVAAERHELFYLYELDRRLR